MNVSSFLDEIIEHFLKYKKIENAGQMTDMLMTYIFDHFALNYVHFFSPAEKLKWEGDSYHIE